MDGLPTGYQESMVDPGRESETLASVDLSAQFSAAVQGDSNDRLLFDYELKKVRQVPKLTIKVDWGVLITDPTRTKILMQWMKALAGGGRNQKRLFMIRGTQAEHDQASQIESNVLASGINWEYTDEATQA